MPSRQINDYRRPFFLFNQHLETIYPALFRKIEGLPVPTKEKLKTPDNDFIACDIYQKNSGRLLIVQHGLEGDSTRPYVLGMVKAFFNNNYDVCAWNYRGCGEEMNLQPQFYHSGATHDLEVVVDRFKDEYDDITLVGFSLGGNLTLKYLGEKVRPSQIKRAIAISAPLDLSSGSDNLSTPNCYIYEARFLRLLRNKIIRKAEIMPDKIDSSLLKRVKTVRDFDELYTGPLHGFRGAEDYYTQNSSKHFLSGIKVPTLIVNALNDPFLPGESLDHRLASDLNMVYFETPAAGGHVGFSRFNKQGQFWSEERALKFSLEY
ncbi:MAG: alpha/beta fold hydrolase [Cyclobacteriaceae bacterium]